MRVGVVLSALAPRAVPSELIATVARTADRHEFQVWAPPGAYGRLRRALPDAVEVHHADAIEQRDASRRRPRRPAALRVHGLPGARVDAVLADLTVDVVMVADSDDARRAARVAPPGTRVLAWQRDVRTLLARVSLDEPRRDDARRVLAYGDLVGTSRFGDAIRAFDAATSRDQSWRLSVQGRGGHAQGLKDLIAFRDLDGVAQVARPRALEDELADAAVLLATSPHPTPPALALAAASAGVPVVGFDDDPVVALVANAGAGIAVPPGSLAALGAALAAVLDDADLRARCAADGRVLAQSLLDESAGNVWAALLDAAARDVDERASAARAATAAAWGADRTALVARTALENAIAAALDERAVPFAHVAGVDRADAIVAGAEHRDGVTEALLSLVPGQIAGIQLCCGDGPAQSRLATSAAGLGPMHAGSDRLRAVAPSGAGWAHLDVELWEADGDGVRIAPRRNRETARVGSEAWQRWTTARGRTVTGSPLWDAPDFPIDAVFTWVDGGDPAWRQVRDQHLSAGAESGPDGEPAAATEERYLSRDEIYYAVAGARSHLPWLRRLIIVTDGQRHDRIAADFPEVEFVDHRDIFPDPAVLPVFNSHAIEASLHRIPGLAEHFIYLNDDMVVVRPLGPERFFSANGVAHFFPSPLTIGFEESSTAEPHLLAAARNRRLIDRDFGVEISRSMLHVPYAHVRSVLEEMDERYEEDFQRTRASRFRSGDDLSVLSSFAQHYGFLTRRYHPSEVEYRFVRLARRALEARLDAVASDRAVEVVCLGEPHAGQDRHPDERRIVREFLERLVDPDR